MHTDTVVKTLGYDALTPKKAAQLALAECGMKAPPVLAGKVALALGVPVVFGKANALAEQIVSFYDPRRGCIFVNQDAPFVLTNFSIARDIGHFLLHSELDVEDYRVFDHTHFYDINNKFVAEATEFATELLVGEDLLKIHGDVKALRIAIARKPELLDQLANWHMIPPRVMNLTVLMAQ